MSLVSDAAPPPSSSTTTDSSNRYSSEADVKSDIPVEHIANRKDELVRLLESRSLELTSFTYSLLPDRAQEYTRALEEDIDRILLNAHKQLAAFRLYGEGSGTNAAKSKLKHLETLVKEAETCHERFQKAKNMNPNPFTTAIVPISGVDELRNRARQSLVEQENVKKALENITDNCKRLLESSEHMRKMLRNLHEQNQLIFFKQVQLASLIDEVATYSGICVRDKVAEDLHTACLSQAASEFSVESWVNKIKECKSTMQSIRTEALTFLRQKEVSPGKEGALMTEEQRLEIQKTIANNTNRILQLSRGAESLMKQLSKND